MLRGGSLLKHALIRVGFILLYIYMMVLGGGLWGILLPEFRLLSLGLLALLAVTWLVVRTRAGWRWHSTPLDKVWPLWALAIVLSMLLNPESARRALLALWYIGLYAGLWYLLHDLIANQALPRRTIADGILFAGVIIIASTITEIPTAIQWRTESGALYRFYSIIGNPNVFGAFLLVMLLVTAALAISTRTRAARIALTIIALVALFMLLLTFARSAWAGVGVALLVWLGWQVYQRRLNAQVVRQWWHQQTAGVRLGIGALGAAALLAGGYAAVLLLRSFSGDARGLSFRPELFNVALGMFSESPLVGQGLFSFGRHVGRFQSIPPGPFHAHAHSVPVNLAGELGLAGLAVAALSVYFILRWIARPRPDTPDTRFTEMTGAACIGFAVMHLFDVMIIIPSIAITGLLLLIMATAPGAPIDTGDTSGTRRWIPPRGLMLAGLWGALFVTSIWDIRTYDLYFDALLKAIRQGTYSEAAAEMQAVTEADPALVIYPAQQGLLWGLAAHEGDAAAQDQAIAAYERAVALEPYFAPFYANLSVLYWNDGQQQRGLETMQQATALASESWPLLFQVGLFAEQLQQPEVARDAYAQALVAEPDADLHPAWGQTPLQGEFQGTFDERSYLAQTVLLMEAGQIEEAAALLNAETDIWAAQHYVLHALLALAQDDREAAQQWYERALRVYDWPEAGLWRLLGAARLARYDGDDAAAAQALEEAADLMAYDIRTHDYGGGGNLAVLQHYRQGISRQFLPDVFYTRFGPVLLYLLETT